MKTNTDTIFYSLKDKGLPLTILVLLVFTITKSPQNIHTHANDIVQQGLGHLVLVFALALPLIRGLGVNFSIIVGAIAGQMGLILAINMMGFGGSSLLVSFVIATLIAILLGAFVAYCMKRAGNNAMVASLFIAYFINGVYQYITLNMFGSLIPIREEKLLLSHGTGLRNSIELHGLDKYPQIPIFLALALILFIGILGIVYKNYFNGSGTYSRSSMLKSIMKPLLGLLTCLFLAFAPLPIPIDNIANIKVSSVALTASLLVYGILIFVLNKLKKSNRTKTLIDYATIILSIILASWGQIISVQTSGAFTTYGSHLGVASFALLALVIGGASLSKTRISHIIIGSFLLQALLVIWPMLVQSFFNEMQGSESLRIILINGLIVYYFVKSQKNMSTDTGIE